MASGDPLTLGIFVSKSQGLIFRRFHVHHPYKTAGLPEGESTSCYEQLAGKLQHIRRHPASRSVLVLSPGGPRQHPGEVCIFAGGQLSSDTVVRKTQAFPTRTHSLFRKLTKSTDEVVAGDASAEAVHDLRTTARRLETLLKIHGVDDRGAGSKLAKQLARLRRRAGKLRDIDVHIAALASVRLGNAVRDRSTLNEHLTKRRSKQEQKLGRIIKQESSNGLGKHMKRALKELQQAPDHRDQPDHTAEALSRFRALVNQTPALTAKTLHAFRIDCKHIRYWVETSETQQAERAVAELKRIQDAIGEWHDWLTLTELGAKLLPSRSSSLMAALRTETGAKYNEALRITAEAKQQLLAMHSGLALVSKAGSMASEKRGINQRKRRRLPTTAEASGHVSPKAA